MFNMLKNLQEKRGLQKPSLIDLIFSRDENMVDDMTHQAALGSSDHDGLLWNYTTKSGLWASYTGGKTKNYAKGDYEKIRSQFRETDWNSKLDGLSCEDAWDKFKVAYNDAVDKNVPLRTKKKNKPPWLKSSVKKSIKKKHKLFQRYRKTDHVQ